MQLVCNSDISQWHWVNGLKAFRLEIPINQDYSYAARLSRNLTFLTTVANNPAIIERTHLLPSLRNAERWGVCVSQADMDNIIKPLLTDGIVTVKVTSVLGDVETVEDVTLMSPNYLLREQITQAKPTLYQDNYRHHGFLPFEQKHDSQISTSDLDFKFS